MRERGLEEVMRGVKGRKRRKGASIPSNLGKCLVLNELTMIWM